MIINVGIRRVVYIHSYPDPLADVIAREAGLELVQLDLIDEKP
jgi:dCMP deaminase